MIRTQIQLTDEQVKTLKYRAAESKQSVASLIRTAVDRFLANNEPDRSVLYRQAQSVIGKYEADFSDISVEHDHYLDEVFGE